MERAEPVADRGGAHVARAERTDLGQRRVGCGGEHAAALQPVLEHVHHGSLRAEPLLRRSRAAPGRPDADRRRKHRRGQRSRGHDDLQLDEQHVLPGTGYVRRPVVSHRDGPSERKSAGFRRGQHRAGSAGPAASVRGRVDQLAAVDLQPADEHVGGHAERGPDVSALPVHVRPLRRQGLRRRPGHHHAHLRSGDGHVVDGRNEPLRRNERRDVPIRISTARRSTTPARKPL
jgi:hypothetical protein